MALLRAPLHKPMPQRAKPGWNTSGRPACSHPAQLQQVFADNADMLAFYEKRSGVPYPLLSYR